ncbi:ATP-binding protein [Roseovarius nanhaiticus]|uniref:ATP-binding protein n=1 Tax=Roseovarius nanhaiticus TaxID=573024 RepID=UPI0024933378|nr:ATP-binding protein [Roseovarius nanhaiticus]
MVTAAGTQAGLDRADQPKRMRLIFTASPEGVRDALRNLRAYLHASQLGDDASGTVEIVLAEALNNVAEHAYAMSGDGDVRLEVTLSCGHLQADITDAGSPLPGLDLPRGTPPCLDKGIDLPEGGFGWFLIHRLTSALTYRREKGRNHLHIEVRLTP